MRRGLAVGLWVLLRCVPSLAARHWADLVPRGAVSATRDAREPAKPAPPELCRMPWWLPRSAAIEGRGVLRVAKRRVEQRLRLGLGLVDLVLDFVPLRSYYIAATSEDQSDNDDDDDDLDEIFLWEVVVSPGRVLDRIRCVSLRRPQKRIRREAVASIWFVPRKALLAIGTGRGATAFWDVRSGKLLEIGDRGLVAGVSPTGDMAVGTAVAQGVRKVALWFFSEGLSRPRFFDAILGAPELEGTCLQGVFTPSGDRIAILVRQTQEYEGGENLWGVHVLDVASGMWTCSSGAFRIESANEDDFVPIEEVGISCKFRVFAFDGERVLLRHESSAMSVLFHMRHADGRCRLVNTEWREACDDAFLSRGLLLRTNYTAASLERIVGPSSVATVRDAEMPGPWEYMLGKFSPDGRKALVSVLGDESFHYIWDFAGPPHGLSMFSPVFTPDSAAVLGSVFFQPHLTMRHLDGSGSLSIWHGHMPNALAISGLFGWT